MHDGHKDNQHFIIGIGASAGGMDAINAFFDNTLPDDVSYIIIQHLSADYKSRMAELLAKHSKLKVVEAQQNMKVYPNEIYLIPSSQHMTIQGGHLHLTSKVNTGHPHLTINTFFQSLAIEKGNKAIGILLSGAGSDGSEGIEYIKNAGGLVIVQDPVTAEYSSIPKHAIATGAVDYVLIPEAMPAVISHYVKHELQHVSTVLNDNEERSVTVILNMIKEKLPLDFTEYKPATILRRIRRRQSFHSFSQIELYETFLTKHPDELDILAKSFLISVSSFFRNHEAFDALADTVLPEMIKDKDENDELKVWVAGCATGEEAYSLAILLQENEEVTRKNLTIKIFATDIDTDALYFAGKGIYPGTIAHDVTPERLSRFFTSEKDYYKIKPQIRKMLIFAQHNVIRNPPYCNMDLISCRNMLIYMNNTLQKKVFTMLHFGLKKGGYLFLGPSENLTVLQPYLMEINKKWKIYKNVESSKSVRFDLSTPPLITETGLSSFTIPAKNKNTLGIGKHPVYEEIATAIIEENGYACICVDHNHQVLKYFGDVSRFLLPKVFTFDLQEVFPKPLAIAFQTASHKALKDNEKVTIKGITIPDSPHVRQVDMTVRPLQPKDTNSNIFIILLNENTDASEHLTKDALLFDSTLYVNTYMTTLEEELKATKEQLHDSIEKLAVSEENMHSFGEELLSANEEMQSSNEELQSVNEELQTINTDYQLKIRELTILNDDLNNYFRSNINGQLFVDNDMLLKKFSPTTTKHINLRDSDIGRPLNNITTNIKFSTIENDIRRVLTTGESFSQEVESDQGNWYQMKIVPYIRQSDNTQDGAIVSFNDITAMKETQRVLTQTNQSLKRINEDLDNFVYAASHDLLGPLTSIEGLMKFLHEKIDMADPDIKLFTDMIQSSIVKFKENLHELADIGKIESEMLRETKKLDISKILEEVLFSIQDKITSSKAVIIRNIQDREVVFSRKNLRSLLYNLISNAIKFKSPERIPEIHISTYRKEEFLVLQVKDNGIGIESDKIHSIFTMYKRFHHEIDGLGLGLYLVKKIVDASGGMTEVESQPGISTTFRIFFKVGTDTADA